MKRRLFCAAMALALSQHANAMAAPALESQKVLTEVMEACHIKSVSQVMLVILVGSGPFLAADYEKSIVRDDQTFRIAQRQTACWTRARYERYVHALFREARDEEAAAQESPRKW